MDSISGNASFATATTCANASGKLDLNVCNHEDSWPPCWSRKVCAAAGVGFNLGSSDIKAKKFHLDTYFRIRSASQPGTSYDRKYVSRWNFFALMSELPKLN